MTSGPECFDTIIEVLSPTWVKYRTPMNETIKEEMRQVIDCAYYCLGNPKDKGTIDNMLKDRGLDPKNIDGSLKTMIHIFKKNLKINEVKEDGIAGDIKVSDDDAKVGIELASEFNSFNSRIGLSKYPFGTIVFYPPVPVEKEKFQSFCKCGFQISTDVKKGLMICNECSGRVNRGRAFIGPHAPHFLTTDRSILDLLYNIQYSMFGKESL